MMVAIASKGKRIGAFAIDLAISYGTQIAGGLAGGFFGGIYYGERGNPQLYAQMGVSFASVFLMIYALYCLFLWDRGLSVGKMILKLRVVHEDTGEPARFGTMLLRNFLGKMISGGVLGIGYLWIIWDKDSQGWHDKIASTIVVDETIPIIQEVDNNSVEEVR